MLCFFALFSNLFRNHTTAENISRILEIKQFVFDF